MSLIPVRKLNARGLDEMEAFLDSFSSGEGRPLSDIDPILTGFETTTPVPNLVRVDRSRVFERRFDLAEYLHPLIPALGLRDPTRDQGLWAWLSLLWFEQLAPFEKGSRKVGERAKWISEGEWKTYRHLVLGPYLLYDSNRDLPRRAMSLLFNPPHTPGELVGQLAATYRVVQAQAAIGAATALYFNPTAKAPKRGAGGSGPGSPRRFRTVLEQFDRTFDLQSLTESQLLTLLPREFDKYKPDGDRR